MIYIVLNAVPILAAAVLSLAIAAAWYRKPAKLDWVVTLFVAQAWLAAILAGALILAPQRAGVWVMTLGSAFIIWVGFVLPALAGSYRLRGVAWRSVTTDTSYWLVSMLAQAALMRVIGLTPPPGG